MRPHDGKAKSNRVARAAAGVILRATFAGLESSGLWRHIGLASADWRLTPCSLTSSRSGSIVLDITNPSFLASFCLLTIVID
jgi:hypothetical protein